MVEAPPRAHERRYVTLDALRTVLGRAPVWLAVFAFEVFLALAPALVFHGWMSEAIAHRYAPGALFANLESSFRFDQREELEVLGRAHGELGALLALAAMLFGCFSAGGWLQIFLERTHGESLRRFCLGGARYFWRFARLLLFTLVTLAGLAFVVYGWPWQRLVLGALLGVPASDFDALETLSSERIVFTLRFAQHTLFAAGFGLVLAWGDYARTRLALHDTSSAVWAGLTTWWTVLRHPVKTLAPYAWLFLLELVLVVGLGFFARSVELDLVRAPEAVGIGVLFVLSQMALLWRVILRGARYHAAVSVSREIVRPIARPDPWKQSVGGPGGPRYPLDTDDEYAVSM